MNGDVMFFTLTRFEILCLVLLLVRKVRALGKSVPSNLKRHSHTIMYTCIKQVLIFYIKLILLLIFPIKSPHDNNKICVIMYLNVGKPNNKLMPCSNCYFTYNDK